jgi:hypothetical protein
MIFRANYVKSAKMVKYVTFSPTLPPPPRGGRGGINKGASALPLSRQGRGGQAAGGAGPARDRAEGCGPCAG